MTIDEIDTIRLALDTPEDNIHYVKHVTDAKIILNKEEEAINYSCSPLQLKDYSELTFEDWLRVNKYIYDSYRVYKDKDNNFISQNELERLYRKELNL